MENTTAIEVLAKITEENLRTKNAEFLAKYPTDDSQIDYYTELAMKVFDKFEIDGSYSFEGVRTNVEIWFKNKRAQMDLFRKHPYWNEEAKAIIFVQDELRIVDYNKAITELSTMEEYVRRKTGCYNNDGLFLGLYYALHEMHENDSEEVSAITEEFIRRFKSNVDREIPEDIERMLKVGRKITKLAHKCYTQWYNSETGEIIDATTLVDEHAEGDRTYNSFDKYYARFADALSELMVKKITLVSLHFCDFMLMSNGNSWSSCHYINSHNIFHENNTSSYSGCYKQGCLSYALDEPSFLLYTLPSTYEGDEYYYEQKINRMCCQYHKGILITGKCYPDNTNRKITRYRQILQLILSSIEGVPNLWTFSRNVDRISTFVETDDYAAHYRDYESSDQKPTISLCKNLVDLDTVMTIGHEAYCLDCGTSLAGTDARNLQCHRHYRKSVCSCCGRYLDEYERIEIGGEFYCKDCCFWCASHDRYETNAEDGRNELELADGEIITVCDDGLDYYFRCDRCGLWHPMSDAHYGNGERYCEDCYDELKAEGKWKSTFNLRRNCVTIHRGDYLLIKEHPQDYNDFGTNSDMINNYAGRIVRVMSKEDWRDGLYVTVDGINAPWVWSSRCFEGKIIGDVSDEILGKTMEEIA